MSDQKKSPENSKSTSPLDDFNRKLESAKSRYEPIDEEMAQRSKGWAIGIRYASDFSAAVLVGALMGFGVDYVLNSTPWGLLIGLILGFATGIKLIVQHAAKANSELGQDP